MAGSGVGEAGGAALAVKFGLLKLLAGAGALLGAFLMAAVFEPKTKREMFLRAFVALAASILFTGWLVKVVAHYFDMQIHEFDAADLIEITLAVAGMVGACAWFVFGALGELLRKFRERPLETAERVKRIVAPAQPLDYPADGGGDVPPSGDGGRP